MTDVVLIAVITATPPTLVALGSLWTALHYGRKHRVHEQATLDTKNRIQAIEILIRNGHTIEVQEKGGSS